MTLETAPRHAPEDYDCPLCGLQAGRYDSWNQPTDVVCTDEFAFARISPKYWIDAPGNVLVCPTDHVENLYLLTAEQNRAVFSMVQTIAVAMRAAYDCEGVSIRQHNEPAGDQDLWHLHVHVLPRRRGDNLYLRHTESAWLETARRAEWADRLRRSLDEVGGNRI